MSNPKIARWDLAKDRFKPETWPIIEPSFKLLKGSSIFTIGSCFARNIEEYLARKGFDIPTLKFSPPLSERSERGGITGKGRPNSIINKYTTASVFQEIEWAYSILKEDVSFEDSIEKFKLEAINGLIIDNQLAGFIPVTETRFLERRVELLNLLKSCFESDYIVLTLGLVEAWFDNQKGVFIQEMPKAKIFRNQKNRFQLKVLDYNAALKHVESSVKMIRELNENAKFIVTVSPVPFGRTFSNYDVIIANSYSKSTLRAVAGDVVNKFENADYFPSYEIVTNNTNTIDVWQEDLIHVKGSFVNRIVDYLTGHYIDVEESNVK